MLEVKNLTVSLENKNGTKTPLVKNLSYSLKEGQTLAIVGESGCGKTIQALSVMGILPPNIQISNGKIIFEGKNLLELPKKDRRNLNGKKIALIFQDALTSLNPVLNIEEHFLEVYESKTDLSLNEAKKEIIKLLEQVELPERVLSSYPHQLSGGQRQRIMIALALTLKPKLLIADEPTTALDENTQTQIIKLLKKLQKEFKTAVIFITHDLNLAKETADKIIVLYAGMKLEEANAEDLFKTPLHPYTYGLLKSIINNNTPKNLPLYEISGTPLFTKSEGCPFQNRCSKIVKNCSRHLPPLEEILPNHFCACFWAKNVKTNRGENGK